MMERKTLKSKSFDLNIEENINYYLIWVEGQTEVNYLTIFLKWLHKQKKPNFKIDTHILKNKNILDSKENYKEVIEKEASVVSRKNGINERKVLKMSKIILDVDRKDNKLALWKKLINDKEYNFFGKNVFLSNPDFELFLLMHKDIESFKKLLSQIKEKRNERRCTKSLVRDWTGDSTASYRNFLQNRNIDKYPIVRENYLNNNKLLVQNLTKATTEEFSNVANLLDYFIFK